MARARDRSSWSFSLVFFRVSARCSLIACVIVLITLPAWAGPNHGSASLMTSKQLRAAHHGSRGGDSWILSPNDRDELSQSINKGRIVIAAPAGPFCQGGWGPCELGGWQYILNITCKVIGRRQCHYVPPVSGKTIFVDGRGFGTILGSDWGTGTAANPFRTIPPAIAAAAPGDTLSIRTGLYYFLEKPLVFYKAGTVQAENGIVTIGSPASPPATQTNAPVIVLKSFENQWAPTNSPFFRISIKLGTSGSALTVSNSAMATLSILELSKDGAPAASQSDDAIVEGPDALQLQSLVPLTPGSTVVLGLDAIGTTNPILDFFAFGPALPMGARVFTYSLTRPGTYKMRVRYQYKGPDNGESNVFRHPVDSNEIVFKLN
jgi:hypothetical protein